MTGADRSAHSQIENVQLSENSDSSTRSANIGFGAPAHLQDVGQTKNARNNIDREMAWQRVEEKLQQGLPAKIVDREFCRFLGVVETQSNEVLPDFMLAICPNLLETTDIRVCKFSLKRSIDKTNRLQLPRVIISESRDSSIREISRDAKLERVGHKRPWQIVILGGTSLRSQ